MSTKVKGNQRARNAGPIAILVVGAVAVLGFMVYLANQPQSEADKQRTQLLIAQENMKYLKKNQFGCVSSPVKLDMPGLEREDCKSATHVGIKEKVQYTSDPPVSGDHYDKSVNPGFYTEPQVPEELVHSLEHGQVVIYYDPAKLPQQDLEQIKELARPHTDPFEGVVVTPRSDAKHPLILTAWEHTLRLEAYDQAKVEQFVDAFRGRGPEMPVRPIKG